MDTNHFTTSGTTPFKLFIHNEISDSGFMDHFQIINDTHSIFGSVPLIHLFQPGTGKAITAIGAMFGFAFGELFAVFDFTCNPAF